MKEKIFAFFSLLAISQAGFAWVNHDNVVITRIIQFEGGIGRDYSILEFSGNGPRCRIPHLEKEFFSFALAAHMAQRPISAICHDEAEDPGASSYTTHKLHRLYTN